jgi:3-oxoacyl-[acyl-carrier-protein] synthase II
MHRRVVITGVGTINPLACDIDEFWHALRSGRSGVGPIQQFDTNGWRVRIGGEVKGFRSEPVLDARAARRMDRVSQFAVVAADAAVRDSGLDFAKEDPHRCGVILGNGIGGYAEFEEQHSRFLDGGPAKLSPFLVPKLMPNAAPGQVALTFGLCGPSATVSTACASAAHALADAFRAVRWGDADVMLAGGTEASLTPMGLAGFVAARALSERNDRRQAASRPFDHERDGFVMSEGAGILVLEELGHALRRGAAIYAEFLGCGRTTDAHHLTAPHPDGDGTARAMRLALREAGVGPEDVQYINAHGTSTPLGYEAETKAIKQVFGEHAYRLAVSSTKSMVGHTLGACGGIELIATVLSIKYGAVHPTINYESPDPACDLDYVPNVARDLRVRRALSNSFGFGGHNCCLAVGELAA